MKITLKLLATYEKLLPPDADASACVIDIHVGSQPKEILMQYGVPTDNNTVILVNGRAPQDETVALLEGDVLCAFPAATGG